MASKTKPIEVGSHRFLDFKTTVSKTTPWWWLEDHSDYISSIFESEGYVGGGTQTAGALNRKTVTYINRSNLMGITNSRI